MPLEVVRLHRRMYPDSRLRKWLPAATIVHAASLLGVMICAVAR
jgi:hypothetical protein